LNQERKVAFRAALEAGRLLKERVGQIKSIDYKSAFNLVTDVDKASEKLILEIFASEFPDDAVLAEESGALKGTKPRRWLIDPLDGTTNFAHGYPFFCVSIGLEVEGQVMLGVIYDPIKDELFWAERGGGAWLNDDRIIVSKNRVLAESLLATGFPPDTRTDPDGEARSDNMTEFRALTSISHGVRRDGSAALDLAYVASGRTDGFWEKGLAAWDVGAGSVIVEEAGGRVTNLEGGHMDVDKGDIIASNGHVHDEILSVLSELKAGSSKR
jgi:Archaeal fructose-1,6-bisphosphatase and related enzymes of inositol monophosphatase family